MMKVLSTSLDAGAVPAASTKGITKYIFGGGEIESTGCTYGIGVGKPKNANDNVSIDYALAA